MLHDRRPKWFYIISSCLVFSSALYLYYSPSLVDDKAVTFHPLMTQQDETVIDVMKPGYFVFSNSCKISQLPITNQHLSKYFKEEKFHSCNKWNDGKPRLVGSNRTFLFMIKSATKFYQKSNRSAGGDRGGVGVKCYYRPFSWVFHKPGKFGTIKAKYGKSRTLKNPVDVTDLEYVRVECFVRKKKVYTDFFSFVPRREDRISDEDGKRRFSVLMVGLDAVSRMNFIRQMPKTYEYLESLDLVDLRGYNKIGDNTFPNLVAMLTGLSEKELTKTCWPHLDSTFDECPFVWKKFSNLGYKTLWAEDSFLMSTFHYIKSGFRRSPTDYYYNIFSKESEDIIGNSRLLNAYLCVGSQLIFKTILEYTLKFSTTLKNQLYFGFVWTVSLTHDYLNLPRVGDNVLLNFMKTLVKNQNLDNTILVLTSDHGLRWGEFRETYQGHLEERLPFLFFILPKKFKREHWLAYRNILVNQHRLTTPYDVHETLNDLLSINRIENGNVFSLYQNTSVRGISLFRRIPDTRDCSHAGIPVHYCTCHNKLIPTSVDSPAVLELSQHLVSHINNVILKNAGKKCSRLVLHKVTQALYEQAISSVGIKKSGNWTQRDYTITVITQPGLATFESTMRYNVYLGTKEILGDVSRLNIYKNQSHCMDDSKLKLYCYCS